jgi:hypothetical protein
MKSGTILEEVLATGYMSYQQVVDLKNTTAGSDPIRGFLHLFRQMIITYNCSVIWSFGRKLTDENVFEDIRRPTFLVPHNHHVEDTLNWQVMYHCFEKGQDLYIAIFSPTPLQYMDILFSGVAIGCSRQRIESRYILLGTKLIQVAWWREALQEMYNHYMGIKKGSD